jgi:hypothetical protein
MDPAIQSRFMALLQEKNLADPSWILSVDEFDEPPLFSRNDQVEFLRPLPEKQRMIATLEIALSTIEMVANQAAQGAPGRVFFVCATFSDFDSWRAGAQIVPTPAIYVNPKDDETVSSGLRLVEPWSEEAALVSSTLTARGQNYADRYCVGELSAEVFDPEIGRVYLGWRDNPAVNVKSVGGEIRKTES